MTREECVQGRPVHLPDGRAGVVAKVLPAGVSDWRVIVALPTGQVVALVPLDELVPLRGTPELSCVQGGAVDIGRGFFLLPPAAAQTS